MAYQHATEIVPAETISPGDVLAYGRHSIVIAEVEEDGDFTILTAANGKQTRLERSYPVEVYTA